MRQRTVGGDECCNEGPMTSLDSRGEVIPADRGYFISRALRFTKHVFLRLDDFDSSPLSNAASHYAPNFVSSGRFGRQGTTPASPGLRLPPTELRCNTITAQPKVVYHPTPSTAGARAHPTMFELESKANASPLSQDYLSCQMIVTLLNVTRRVRLKSADEWP